LPVFHPEGSAVVYLSDEQRAQRITRLKEQIRDLCE
jgi:hypothetical protein